MIRSYLQQIVGDEGETTGEAMLKGEEHGNSIVYDSK